MTTVRKAVFPAAGLGTRFLPATKAQPKEMLVLVDKPIIQYRRRGGGGLRAWTTSSSSRAAARTPSRTTSTSRSSWRRSSRRAARRSCSREIRKVSNLINFAYVRQGEPLGLGHAVLVTRELVGQEPFAVILGDDVIDADPPALRQMVDVFDKVQGPVLAVERVPEESVSSYGIVVDRRRRWAAASTG